MNRNRLYLIALAVAGLAAVTLVTVSLAGRGGGTPASPAPTVAAQPSLAGVAEARALFAGIPRKGAILGSPSAPVTLVEYADPQCPYCKQWALGALPTIVDQYVRTGKVRLEFRPLAFVGPESKAGVTALLALGMSGRMWEGMHVLYANQGPENSGWINDNLMGAVVSDLGVGWPKFEYDRYSKIVTRAMAQAKRSAISDGITGTPSFFAGRTGAPLQPVEITSLDASALQPALDRLLRS